MADQEFSLACEAASDDLREITRTVNEVSEMTRAINQDREIYDAVNQGREMYRAIREAGEVCRPLREAMESLKPLISAADSIAAQIPASVASSPTQSAVERTLDRIQRSHIRTVQGYIDAASAARRDVERITAYLPRGGW
jgi:beta-phosphoglucomutase-like phosphatase (HAD superfamily)